VVLQKILFLLAFFLDAFFETIYMVALNGIWGAKSRLVAAGLKEGIPKQRIYLCANFEPNPGGNLFEKRTREKEYKIMRKEKNQC